MIKSKMFSGTKRKAGVRSAVALYVALAAVVFGMTHSASAAVYTYAASPLPTTSDYTVSAGGQNITVNRIDLYNTNNVYTPKSQAGFGFDGSVSVTVTPNYSYSSFKVRPDQYGINATRSGNAITFTLNDNTKGKVVVEFDNDYNKSLFLFADPPIPSVPSGARYYGPGSYSGDINVGNGETVYLAPGAVVTGDINMKYISGGKVIGRGWVMGSVWTDNANSCEISGVHLAQRGKWTVNLLSSSFFTLRDLKLMYLGGETDGISFNDTGNSSAKNCFIMNADDVFTSQRPGCHDNLTQNIVVWSEGGGNIFGPGGTEDMGGNNVYKDIYVVKGKNNFLTHHWSNGPKNIPSFTLENVYCDPRVPFQSFIYMNGITNVGKRYYTLKNIYAPWASSRADGNDMHFTLDNIVLGGNRMTSISQMNLTSTGAANTFDFPGSGINLIGNSSFDAENYNTQTPSSWNEYGNNQAASYTEDYGGSKSGARHGTHWSSNAYQVYTYQTKTGLANGLYTLSTWAKSGGGQKACYIEAVNYGGSARTANLPVNGSYQLVEIKDINVTNGQCQIGFWSDAYANNWCYFDDVSFFEQ